MKALSNAASSCVVYKTLGGFVTIGAFALIAAGPVYQLTAFAIDTGTFSWMQTAYDEPYYIDDAMTAPLYVGERAASRLPAHLMQALGITSFEAIAIISDLLFPVMAFGAAWILAGTLTKAAVERVCWAFALVFGFELFSLNSPMMFSPTLALRLEKIIAMPWLFAADPFPYFNLYRTPEPQTTWILFFLYLALLVRFASSLDLRLYRALCLVTPLFVFCYATVAVSAGLLFIIISIYSIVVLRLPLKLAFAIAVLLICGLLGISSGGQNAQSAAVFIFNSHLPILRASVIIAVIGLAWVTLALRRNHWRVNARLVLAASCASIPLITLNQQILTGKVIYAQQWELYCNYICLVLAFGLLATSRGVPSASLRSPRAFVAGGALLVMAAVIAAGHRYTYQAFLPTNLLSVTEARAYRQAIARIGPVSAVVLPDFWEDCLFRARVPDAAPVLGGECWITHHSSTPLGASELPEVHLTRNAEIFAVGFELLARREFDAAALRRTLQNELSEGLCNTAAYFFSQLDCWDRLSNYRVNVLHHLSPWISPIVNSYAALLRHDRLSGLDLPALVMRLTPIEGTRVTGLWQYKSLGEFRMAAGATRTTIYAYLQTPSGGGNVSRDTGDIVLKPLERKLGPLLFTVPLADLNAANGASATSTAEGLNLVTATARWAYSLTGRLMADERSAEGPVVVRSRLRVADGVIGISVSDVGSISSLIKEVFVNASDERQTVDIDIPDAQAAGTLIFRNASPHGASRAVIQAVEVYRAN